MVMFSAMFKPPWMANVLPSATVVAPTAEPNAFRWVTSSVPAFTETAPSNVLLPDNVSVEPSCLTRLPEPKTTERMEMSLAP